jgi:hypothetical protein
LIDPLWLKVAHVVGSTVLFGTGIGIAFAHAGKVRGDAACVRRDVGDDAAPQVGRRRVAKQEDHRPPAAALVPGHAQAVVEAQVLLGVAERRHARSARGAACRRGGGDGSRGREQASTSCHPASLSRAGWATPPAGGRRQLSSVMNSVGRRTTCPRGSWRVALTLPVPSVVVNPSSFSSSGEHFS